MDSEISAWKTKGATLDFFDTAAAEGHRQALVQQWSKRYNRLYNICPTESMSVMDDLLHAVRTSLKKTYCFVTLRPHNKYTVEGSEDLEHFRSVVKRFKKRKYVDKIICSEWEAVTSDGVERWHWHCLFSPARRISASVVHQGLSRGYKGYLFKSKHSVDLRKVPESDVPKVSAYITKSRRRVIPLGDILVIEEDDSEN